MGIKKKYQIEDYTWQKLKKGYMLVLFATPFITFVFTFCTWPIIDGFSWTFVPILPWSIIYLFALITYGSFFKRSKHTLLILSLFFLLITYFFAVLASAAIFRLFGIIGLIIQSICLLVTITFLCIHYFKYYGKIWESHKYHNENVVLDQENGRYDFLNNFNMDESKVKGKKDKNYSNAALISLIYLISPVGGSVALIFSKGGNYTIPIIIGWILSIPVTFGLIKPVMGGFYNYRKLAFFEKKLGKPIINGLIE